MVSKRPQKPNPKLLRRYLKRYEKETQYTDSDKALRQLVRQNPSNRKIADVILKATAINDISSTQIYNIHRVAKHIKRKKIDTRLKKGSPDLVDDIAKVTIHGKRRRLFSFASKYCHLHNPKDYPKRDRYVCRMLSAYKHKYGFGKNGFNFFAYELNDNNRFNYPRFKEILSNFRKHFNLTRFSFSEL